MRKSWLRKALPVFAVLVASNIVVNTYQSLHDVRAADQQAAQRLDVQTSLIQRLVEDRLRDLNGMMAVTRALIDADNLTDKSLHDVTDTLKESLGDSSIAVFDGSARLVAGSRPGIRNEISNFTTILDTVRAAPATHLWLPVVWRQSGALVVAEGHRNRAGKFDAIAVYLIPLEQHLLEGVKLVNGTAIILSDSEHRVIARYPRYSGLAIGHELVEGNAARQGPIPGTHYARWSFDPTERLVATRRIVLGPAAGYWTLDVGYAVSGYRDSLRNSMYINLAGATLLLLMLAGGVLLIQREHRLHDRIEGFAGTVLTIVQNMPTPVTIVDIKTENIVLANEALLALFGAVAGKGQPFSRLFVDAGSWTRVREVVTDEPVPLLTRDGIRHMLVHCTRLRTGDKGDEPDSLLVTLVDITHQHQLLKQLRTEADFDALTGLANRRYFAKAAEKAVEHARRHHRPLSVLALDLDFFKRVNDTWGHAAGDRVLQVTARSFENALREDDLAARLGGEEFAAILLDTDLEQARTIAERIRIAVQDTPISLESGATVSQTLSIGIALYDEKESDLSATQERADAALYAAKNHGRNCVQIWVPDTTSPLNAELYPQVTDLT
ncbi:sensor domain-containing diguanylate cyclase [Paraburkholderia hospita]|uniref:sensor domain-containing diguanylate cyclase n=1 Tax=Paraburkholderia hospita TaxID=169430 RepID=UPI0003E7E671|nr:diguanylate cyclase [Paraburkholderia hospita]EUC19142.1 diguanylate cyclase with PAS/PAC sensor [Burkholderia sp. BT03]SKC63458.1 diguanylate cyclase (GGDEF) domain-containing protein [Paraburkholderia hospita]